MVFSPADFLTGPLWVALGFLAVNTWACATVPDAGKTATAGAA
jgi:hypothetical protein